jgi:cyclohexanecarboxylate-CoA ligase
VCDANGLGADQWALPLGDPAVLPRYVTATADTPVRCYFYTTGTTGVPKGVIHTEHTMLMCARYQVDRVGINEHDVIPITFPYTHVGGPMVLFGHLRICSKVLFIETWDPVKTPSVVSRMGATVLGSAVPFFLAYLAAQAAHRTEPMFPNLRFGMAGGAPLPPEIDHRFAREMPCEGILNAWGLTECPCPASVVPDDPPWAREGSTGFPVADVVVRIAGPDGAEVPIGQEGEVLVNAPQRFLGYVDSSLDAAALTADGFLRTGDLGKVDEHGYLWITGRIKDIIIRNAENISAVEVEDVLYKHPSIGSVAVIGIPDPLKGEHCCAVIVLAEGVEDLTLAELGVHCRAAGLANQKIPEQIEFVDALPTNSMGKVVKHELRARFAP